MIISYIAIVTLLTVVNLSYAENPGARIILTQKGLNYGLKKALPYLKSTLNDISIPAFSGKKYICSYQLSNIHIGNIDLPELSVTTGKNGLTIKSDDVSLSGGVDYSYKCIGIHGSGRVDLGVSDSSLGFTILVDKDDTGHPLLKPNGCSLDISTFSIEFQGSLSWLANVFKGLIEDKIKSYANADACSKLSDMIKDKGNSFLEEINITMPIDNKIVIDYSLVNNPVFTSVDLQVGIKGEFTSIDSEAEKPPFTPSPIPQVTEATKMVYLVASSYLANTAAFVIQEEGYLKYNVTQDTLPTGMIPLFNTVIFQDLIPEFYNKYPKMNLTLNMYSTKPPILEITTEGAILQGCGVIEVGVYDANCDNAIVHAFSLEVEGSTEVEVGLIQVDSKTNITGKVDTLDLKISVKDTEIGAINAAKITNLVHSLGNQLIIPIVNRYLSVGWPIPAKYGVELENSEVTLGNDYVLIGTDIKYEIQQPVQQALEHNYVSHTEISSSSSSSSSNSNSNSNSKKLNSRVQF